MLNGTQPKMGSLEPKNASQKIEETSGQIESRYKKPKWSSSVNVQMINGCFLSPLPVSSCRLLVFLRSFFKFENIYFSQFNLSVEKNNDNNFRQH